MCLNTFRRYFTTFVLDLTFLRFGTILVPFWGHFWTVSAFWGSPFFDVSLVTLLDGILVSFGTKVAPKRELLGIILETIW